MYLYTHRMYRHRIPFDQSENQSVALEKTWEAIEQLDQESENELKGIETQKDHLHVVEALWCLLPHVVHFPVLNSTVRLCLETCYSEQHGAVEALSVWPYDAYDAPRAKRLMTSSPQPHAWWWRRRIMSWKSLTYSILIILSGQHGEEETLNRLRTAWTGCSSQLPSLRPTTLTTL